jgi:Protein of unknown function (DUF1573)
MKKIFFIISVLFVFACSSKNAESDIKINPNDTTAVEFTDAKFEFGTIQQGEQVSYTFKFKNTGDKPLLITDVHSSCGCTIPSYSEEPLSPGSEGFLKVTFNSAGKHGNQYKIITVVCNTNPEKTELVISGNVKVPTDN